MSLKKRLLWFNLFCLLSLSSVGLVSCCAKKVPPLPPTASDNLFPYEAFVHIKVVPKDDMRLVDQFPKEQYEYLKNMFVAMGSGAVIENDGYTEIVTAGHVCDSSDLAMAGPFKNFEIYAYDWRGDGWKADIRAIDHENDLCLLQIENVEFPDELEIASKDPVVGDQLFLAASPLGLFVKEMPLLFDGYYAGTDPGGTMMTTIPVAPGSSGGAIVNRNGEIVGIVTAGLVEFKHVGLGTSWVKLEEFLLWARNEINE